MADFNKPIAKKIILQFHHNQEKLYFWQCKVVELYDVATVHVYSIIGQSKEDAAERLKLYFSNKYEIAKDDFIVKLEPAKKANE